MGRKRKEIEYWKSVPEYEGLYYLSNRGQLYSTPRQGGGGFFDGNKIPNGYKNFTLTKDGKSVSKSIQQWMWITFVGPIPKGYDIHHKNHNRQDNRLENLCLMEHKKHIKEHNDKPILQYTLDGVFVKEYQSRTEAEQEIGKRIHLECNTSCGYLWVEKGEENKINEKIAKNKENSVLQFTKDNVFVKEYRTQREAAKETGISYTSISLCCTGKNKTAGGYKWKYKEKNIDNNIAA